MRDFVRLQVNGVEHQVRGEQMFLPVTDFLRYTLGLTGTKVVCSEGDCGACSVVQLVANSSGEIQAQPMKACLTIPALLDGAQLVTVEALQNAQHLHPVQEAMITHQGAQCGFCTPGIVCTLAALFDQKKSPDLKQVRNALTGNLCRCTGYEPILTASQHVKGKQHELRERFYDAKFEGKTAQDDLLLQVNGVQCFAPLSLKALCDYKQKNRDARIVASATDIGVQVNKGKSSYANFCSPYRIKELTSIQEESDAIVVGAKVTLTALQQSVEKLYPEFFEMLKIFASPQIKNVATLVGNVANASPIGDTLPFLMAMNAIVVLQSAEQNRHVAIENFYLGYKKMDLKDNEIITHIRIPKLKPGQFLKLFKVSRRKDMDISTVTAAYLLDLKDDVISGARVVYGGVGPTVQRLPNTEDFLKGQTWSEATFAAAGDVARAEVAPQTDVRGSREYRLQLVKNLFLKLYYEKADPAKYSA